MSTHPLFSSFRTFHEDVPPNFEAWFFGVLVRDWLFTGTSKNLPGGLVSVGYPPVDNEYFKWLGMAAAILSAKSRFTMVELGAGWGRWLVAAAKLAAQREVACRLVGVEADPDHFAWMSDVFRDNGLDPAKHSLWNMAVAATRGPALFLRHGRPQENYGQRLIDPVDCTFWESQPNYQTVDVTGHALDEIIEPLDCVDFLSVDVNGTELDVLASSLDSLEAVRVLQLSTSSDSSDEGLVSLLESCGWINIFRFQPQAMSRTQFGLVPFNQGLQTWVHRDDVDAQDLLLSNVPAYPMSPFPEVVAGGGGVAVFDTADAVALNDARLSHLDSLGLPLEDRRVLDVGGGVGHLAQFFVQKNCQVICTDARDENIASLHSRYPALSAHVLNVETDSLARLGRFDIVFCYGLLYHLENPVAALRNMASVCSDLLLLESVVIDHPEPLLRVVDEPSATLNQTVGALGTRPSPAFIVMTLSRLGFPFVYAPKTPPQHPDFLFDWNADLRCSRDGHLLRCIFVASRRELNSMKLVPLLRGVDIATPAAAFHPVVEQQPRIWIDVGAHLGEKTLAHAEYDPGLTVYAFEPNISVAARSQGRCSNYIVVPAAIGEQDGSATLYINSFSGADSLLPLDPQGLKNWIGGEQLRVEKQVQVPMMRLDTFMDQMGIRAVEYLKIDAQGTDLAVVRSAGSRLTDIRKITVEVHSTPQPLYSGSTGRVEVLDFMQRSGFLLESSEDQSFGQEQNLTFVRGEEVPAVE
jgi:FkbM family methyltransferase